MLGQARGDVPQVCVPPCRLSDGLAQAGKHLQVVLACNKLVKVHPMGLQRGGHHCFPCFLRHTSFPWAEPTILRRVPARPPHEGSQRVFAAGHLAQLSCCMSV